jgi:hypothetical protein
MSRATCHDATEVSKCQVSKHQMTHASHYTKYTYTEFEIGKSFRTRPGLEPPGYRQVHYHCANDHPNSSPGWVRKLLPNFKFPGFPRLDVLIRTPKFPKMRAITKYIN